MTAVEAGNGQDIHHSKNNGDKGCDVPERSPVPHGGEEAAYGAETSYALSAFLRE